MLKSSGHPQVERLLVTSGANILAESVVDDVETLVSVIRQRFRCEDVQLDIVCVTGRRVRVSHVNRDADRVAVHRKYNYHLIEVSMLYSFI